MKTTNSSTITPTYSTDRDLLLARYPTTARHVSPSVAEARTAFLQWGISTDSTFQRRVNLDTDAAWTAFVESCIVDENLSSSERVIDMDLLLKKCYAVAFSMPSSPVSHSRAAPNIPQIATLEPLSI